MDAADDTSIESRRRIADIEQQGSSSLSEISQPDCNSKGSSPLILSPSTAKQEEDQGQTIQENNSNNNHPSPTSSKKANSSLTESSGTSFGEKQQLGSGDNQVNFDSLSESKVSLCDLFYGSSESGDFSEENATFGVSVPETENSRVSLASDCELKKEDVEGSVSNVKEYMEMESFEVGMCVCADKNKEFVVGNEIESGESLLEVKKKQLLEELEVGSIFKSKTRLLDDNVDGFETNVASLGYLKGVDESVRRSLKVEVIDDTALLEPILVPKACNHGIGVVERNGKKNGKQETDGKKAKRQRRRKAAAKVSEICERQQKSNQIDEARNRITQVGENRNGHGKDGDQMKRKYSREEMESLRFVDIVEQRKLWRDIYTGFRVDVVKGYKDLASSTHQKSVRLNCNPRDCFGRKEDAAGILGEVSSEDVDIKLENMGGDEVEYMNPLDPACSSSIGDNSGDSVLEGEGSEEEDSDDDNANIQRPAFLVDGEPNFDSGPPEDGLEYLRRVRWEAAHIPKVKVAKLDTSRVIEQQTPYMPQIPDIAKCPEHLLPSKQWEEVFLANFSELRQFLSQNDESSTKIFHKMQPMAIVHKNSSTQPAVSNIVVKINNLRTDEVQSYKPPSTSSIESTIDQSSIVGVEEDIGLTLEASVSDASCNYPTLSAILAMDSVARVSKLKERIRMAETLDMLPKKDCVWLFALCAAVDTPLHADTCAAIRSLLRKCASLRACKSELDDEVVMLNILATISGRYFGQSEN